MSLIQRPRPSLWGQIRSFLTQPILRRRPQDSKEVVKVQGGAEARRAAISTMIAPSLSGRPLYTEWTTEKAVKEGMKACWAVYACCFAYEKAVRKIPFRAQVLGKNGEWTDDPKHPAQARMENPNRYKSRADNMARHAQHLLLGGNALAVIVDSEQKRDDPTLELWAVNPDRLSPIPSDIEYLEGYEVRKPTQGRGMGRRFAVEEIVHAMFSDPSNDYWGLAPLEAAARTVDTEVAAGDWNFHMLKNRAVGSGAFSTDHDLLEDSYDFLLAKIAEQHMGAENAGRPWLLTNGAKYQPFSNTLVEMDWLQGKKWNLTEVCAIFGVPPPLLGQSEHATLANLETYEAMFWLLSVIPMLDVLAGAYNRGWVWPRWGEGVRLAYDLSNVDALRIDEKEKEERADRLWRMGTPLLVLNEHFQMGLPPERLGESAAIPFIPSGMIPAEDMLEPEEQEDPEDELEIPDPAEPADSKPPELVSSNGARN